MPRAGLTRDRVVVAAAMIADDVGLDSLTLASVAAHFGVAQPSLYKHVLFTFVTVILEDEREHHRWFGELASSLKTDANLIGAQPVIPRMDFHRADRAAIRDITDRLLECEKADEKDLKRLQREMRECRTPGFGGRSSI